MTTRSGRLYEPELTALAEAVDGGIEVRAPAVGLWRDAPAPGTLVRPGDPLGRLEVLGVLHKLVAPAHAHGLVLPAGEHGHDDPAQRALGYGAAMLVLDPDASAAAAAAVPVGPSADEQADGLVFRASTSGRFYSRPTPERDPFVAVGDVVEVGRTVCLLEVMKTFHRVTYGGKGLPERARVVEIVPADEADLSSGDVILVLESVS